MTGDRLLVTSFLHTSPPVISHLAAFARLKAEVLTEPGQVPCELRKCPGLRGLRCLFTVCPRDEDSRTTHRRQ
jgi:hypothetical protein